MIESSVAGRVRRGIGLWRSLGAEIWPMPSGGLSVPSCSEPGRSYRVSLAGEGRCGCADWRRRRAMQAHLRGAGVGGEAASASVPSDRAAGGLMAACRFEVHHHFPRCLLGFFDRAASAELDAAGLQAWFDWEGEAFRYGVDPDISREDLVVLIDSSTAPIPAAEHRAGHSQAGDFVRWGRRGGLATLALYGRGWFALLARRRWEKITAAQLEEAFAVIGAGRS